MISFAGFFGALCGGGGFPLAEKVFLSLKIGARLEWQRSGRLLSTETHDGSCNQDGLPLCVYPVSSLLVLCVVCCDLLFIVLKTIHRTGKLWFTVVRRN